MISSTYSQAIVLYGEEAVTLGIIDHVGGLSDALDSLYRQMDRRREE